MDLRQLEIFVAVAEELNFTRAAGRLHTVQSGVSAAISALERDLRARLFDRTRQRVALSDAGSALLPRARETLAAAQAARDAIDEVRGGLRGTIDLGTMISVGIVDLPALLGQFHRVHPQVTVRLRTMTTGSAGLVDALTTGALDLAFVALAGAAPTELAVRDLASWPMVLVCPADHRLAEAAAEAAYSGVDLRDLADEPFIDFPVGYGNRAVVDQAFAAAGVARRVRLEVADLSEAAGFVRHGLGLAFLPSFVAPTAPRDQDLLVLPVANTAMTWKLSIASARARRPSAAVRAMLRLLDNPGYLRAAAPSGSAPAGAAPPALDQAGAAEQQHDPAEQRGDHPPALT